MKKIYTLLAYSTLIVLCSCAEEKKETVKTLEVEKITKALVPKKTTNTNLNISFLLDLSDRISPEKYPNPAMDFYKRDVAYIQSVAQAFDAHLRAKKVRAMYDKIQLFFDPEPLNPEINLLSTNLKFEITRDNASIELLDKLKNAYKLFPEKIYEQALTDNQYIGSDTWKFFKNKAKDYCVEDGYRNILIILTDGYVYHENSKLKEKNRTSYLTPQTIRNFGLNTSNWKAKIEKGNFGFIPASNGLNDLEILILGVNPDTKNPYEEDIIKHYWTTWLQEMGVKRFVIKNADLPSNMNKLIQNFILKN